ncbi:MAG: DoxX family protein [Methylotenera sp.]|nr:DoxX family protein [Methylotenera sp.]
MTKSSVLRWKFAGRLFVFSWFFIGGICHFAIPEPFLRIIPPYIPYPLATVYISGAFELLGAIGLWVPSKRSLAGYGLMLLTAIVTLANVQMYQHPDMFPSIPVWLLIIRFPIQALLIWLIWWCTRPDSISRYENNH